jgi:uncharacterized protein
MRKLFIISSMMLAATMLQAQDSRFAGTWEGVLNVGIELRIVFHIKQNPSGSLTATADSPDQSAFGIPCDTVVTAGNTIDIEMNSLKANFNGKLVNDSTIEGTFTQGASFTLHLKKGNKAVAEIKRPQSPKPPFPYKSEEVEYDNNDKSIRFGATITIPGGNGPFPAALLITGSGPQNRDEEILGHKPFAVLADHLTTKGYIVLRVDDRGTGKTTGRFETATSEDFANDVHAGIEYLLQRPEVNRKKIGLIGHSEGGMIAPMVATSRKDIDFIVLMAAPGVPITNLMTDQNAAILRTAGISENAVASYSILYRKILQHATVAKDTVTLLENLRKSITEWTTTANKNILLELGLDDPTARESMASTIAHTMASPWFRYFLSFDPAPYIEKLQVKTLVINGDRDIQVISSSNLKGIRESLKKSKAKQVEIKELPGLNHLFQECKTCKLEEYGQIEQTISPIVLETISGWLDKNVRQ